MEAERQLRVRAIARRSSFAFDVTVPVQYRYAFETNIFEGEMNGHGFELILRLELRSCGTLYSIFHGPTCNGNAARRSRHAHRLSQSAHHNDA